MQTQALYDRATIPTRPLNYRDYHRIAVLGRNRIIYDYHKTNFLSTGQVERVTKLLPRKKPSLIERIIRLFRGQ